MSVDLQSMDVAQLVDSGQADLGVTDSSIDLGVTDDGAVDLGTEACDNDSDCDSGVAWCVGGACVPCDNSGLLCDIFCGEGSGSPMRNGCSPCECTPNNECDDDGDCLEGSKCYAGHHCPDWCPEGDPSCCLGGNQCRAVGCDGPVPEGCNTTGCPYGASCETTGCSSGSCACTGTGWICTDDCGGGTCVVAE